jgi:hypothetical protein
LKKMIKNILFTNLKKYIFKNYFIIYLILNENSFEIQMIKK